MVKCAFSLNDDHEHEVGHLHIESQHKIKTDQATTILDRGN